MTGALRVTTAGERALGGSRGLLLLNLGTPDSPAVADVRRYLREFLSDPRVIDLPAPARWLLVNLVILPTRPRASARAYRAIWTAEGSPLLVHGRALAIKVARRLGGDVRVELAMRYGRPGIGSALDAFVRSGIDRIVVFPMFPQYSEATWGSAVARVHELAATRWATPSIRVVPPYFRHEAYVDALAAVTSRVLAEFPAEHLLLSYHGLPERQIRRADAGGVWCLTRDDCCESLGPHNGRCYRAQCFATSQALVECLADDAVPSETAFQSRMGRSRWIGPDTEERLVALAEAGVRRLAVACPSFSADCLETLEEIGLRGRRLFLEHGGEELRLVPALNAEDRWADAVVRILGDVDGGDEG